MSEDYERLDSSIASLSSDIESDGPYVVHGVALGAGDITHGGSGKKTLWPKEVLKEAADGLEGRPLATDQDHTADDPNAQTPVEAIAGEVTWSGYGEVDGTEGILYEAELDDKDLAKKVKNGRIDVSPLVARDVEPLEDHDEAEYRATGIQGWRDLALVHRGASPSNSIDAGSNPAKAAALHEAVEALQDWKNVAGVRFRGTKTGELDESEIPNDADFGDYYLYPGDNKSESSYPVVDSEGYLRRSNVDAAHQLGCRGMCPSDETHDEKLMALAEEFDSPPDWAEDGEAMGAQVEDPALWEACSLSLPESLVDESAESDTEDSPGSDDGPNGSMGQSSAGADDVQDKPMTDELTESEKAILSAAESVEEPTEALEQFAAADTPKIVEQDTYEALNNAVETLDEMMAEALTEDTGLSENAVEAMSFEAKSAHFKTDDGEFKAESLVQEPETGDPEETEGGVEALSDDADVEKAEALYEDMEEFGVDHEDTICEALGVSDWDTAVEVLD